MLRFSKYAGRFFLIPWLISHGAIAQEVTVMQCSIGDMLLRMDDTMKFQQIDPGGGSFSLEWSPAHISGEHPNRVYNAAAIAVELPFSPFIFYKYDLLFWGAQQGFEGLTPYLFEEGATRHGQTDKQRRTVEESTAEIDIEGDYISYKSSLHISLQNNSTYSYLVTTRHYVDYLRYHEIVARGECAPV